MRNRCIAIASFLSILIALSSTTNATEAIGRAVANLRKPTLSYLILLQTQLVQDELEMTEQQVREIAELRSEFDVCCDEICRKYYDTPDTRSLSRRLKDAADPIQVQIDGLLTLQQAKRFEEIHFQLFDAMSFHSMHKSQVNLLLEISQDQQVEIDRVLDETNSKTGSLIPDKLRNGVQVVTEQKLQLYKNRGDDTSDMMSESEYVAIWKRYESKRDEYERKAFARLLRILNEQQRNRLNTMRGRAIDRKLLWEQRSKLAIRVSVKSPSNVQPPRSDSILIQ